jgi:hypothetical protein
MSSTCATAKPTGAIFARANAEDVEVGGRYDARVAAINIWTHAWINEAAPSASETIGTVYFHWADQNHLYLIECDEGFSCDGLLHKLALLERKALGHIKHGKAEESNDY